MADTTYRRIVVALDGSLFAEQVLPHVAPLARAFDARVLLIQASTVTSLAATGVEPTALPRAVPPMGLGGVPPTAAPAPVPNPADWEAEEQADESYLANVAERLRQAGAQATHERRPGVPAEVILDYAREANADLIALTTHGRSGLSRLVFGSVAERVLREAPCPVLLVRVKDEEEQQA